MIRKPSLIFMMVAWTVTGVWQTNAFSTEAVRCNTALSEIVSYKELSRTEEFLEWSERAWRFKVRSGQPFALSFGFYEFQEAVIPFNMRREMKFHVIAPLELRTFELGRTIKNRMILPPSVWYNSNEIPSASSDPLIACHSVAEFMLRASTRSGDTGVLFYFFLDDFQGHRILSRYPLSEDKLKELGLIRANGVLEGMTEGELRILLSDPRFLSRTAFVMKGRVLNATQARSFLGAAVNYFPYFDEVYRPVGD